MKRAHQPFDASLGLLLCLGLSACAASPPQDRVATVAPAPRVAAESGQCDATALGWAVGKLADDALVERARTESGALRVRVLRPGMMITNDVDPTRLNIRVDTERKVLATSCG